jgi:hypothetical protein
MNSTIASKLTSESDLDRRLGRVVQSSMAVVATEELLCAKEPCRAEQDPSDRFRIRIPAHLTDRQLRVSMMLFLRTS